MNTNNSQEESSMITNNNEENIYFEIIYKFNQNGNKIFYDKFINKNKVKCKIIYKYKEYELKEYFEEIDNNYKNKEEISFILKINKNITDISFMFFGCDSLLSIKDISFINNFNNNDILNDINKEGHLSNEKTQNKEKMTYIKV